MAMHWNTNWVAIICEGSTMGIQGILPEYHADDVLQVYKCLAPEVICFPTSSGTHNVPQIPTEFTREFVLKNTAIFLTYKQTANESESLESNVALATSYPCFSLPIVPGQIHVKLSAATLLYDHLFK
jgi:hypothetical protein